MSNRTKIATQLSLSIALMMAGSAASAQTFKKFTASCTNGSFTGTAYLEASRFYNLLGVTMTDYKIQAPSSSKSRSKANANMSVYSTSSYSTSTWARSNDNLKQDGLVHSQWLSANITEARLGVAQVEFVFDKSGNDPKCIAKVQIPQF